MPWEKSFDQDRALAAAADVFYDRGYEAASMTQLLAAMGIQKGSFYATFGSKRDVFVAALRRYNTLWADLFARQREGRSPRDFLVEQMRSIAGECRGKAAARGCFLVNTAIELGPHDPEIKKLCRQALDTYATLMQELIEEAQALGEMDPALDAEANAQMLLSVRLGLRVMGRSGLGPNIARVAVDRALKPLTEFSAA